MTGSGKTDEQPPAGELAALKAENSRLRVALEGDGEE